jgi:uncharacterized integral membrane protein
VRIVRIVQIAIALLAVGYVSIVQNANPEPLALPGLLPLPVWLVVLLTAVLSFLAGWLPSTLRAWRRGREIKRLERRVADLESHVPSYDRASSAPVIPDRAPPPAPGGETERSDA